MAQMAKVAMMTAVRPLRVLALKIVDHVCGITVLCFSYTVVGVVNKFATIILNVLIWDKHASPTGLGAISVCLLAGSFYRQAPMRAEVAAATAKGLAAAQGDA